MKTANLGDLFMYNGRVFKVVGINDGHKSLIIEPLDNKVCECCGRGEQIDIIESSPMFQDNSEPISTISVICSII